jgi:carnitine 3-dehydrogenase
MARKAAIIGGGAQGCGWAARFLLNGWDVAMCCPDPETPHRMSEVLAQARAAGGLLTEWPLPPEGRLTFAQKVEDVAQDADYIHLLSSWGLEALTRRRQLASGAVIGCSAQDFNLLALQQALVMPVLRVCAVDPVYLLPLAEVTHHANTSSEHIEKAKKILREIGMVPLCLTNDVGGGITDRLAKALSDAASELVQDGVATPEDIDSALALGLGLHWALGGASGSDRPSDAQLVALLRAMKDRNIGAGRALVDHDARRRTPVSDPTPDPAAPMEMAQLQVLPSWIDYNGHMTESRYLFACSEITDAFLRHIGAGLDYVAGGHSYYSAETHILHKGEAKLGDRLAGTVQVLGADAKRMHLFVTIARDGRVVATLEQMLLHVDMAAARACPAAPAVLARLMPIADAHKALPWPDGAGRHVGQARR